MADLDRDGLEDLITPAWPGQVLWFRQQSPGEFAEGKALVDSKGQSVRTEWMFGATSCDWNADGWPDIVVCSSNRGSGRSLFLLLSSGQADGPRFPEPQKLNVGEGTEIINAALVPVATDWNADGLFDFVIGSEAGEVVWFRNVGRSGQPAFEAPEILIAQPDANHTRGGNAQISIVDWNGDGKPDILLGDTAGQFQKVLSQREQQIAEQSKARSQNAASRWAQVFRLFQSLRKRPQSEKNSAAMDAARRELVQLKRIQEIEHRTQSTRVGGQQTHGRVWVFLQQAK